MFADLPALMAVLRQHATPEMVSTVGEASRALSTNWTTSREWVSLPQVTLLGPVTASTNASRQIWISPVTYQLQGNTVDGEAYHGYWQQDLYQINSNFGTAADLESLASALHDRDMVCIGYQ